MPSFNLTVELVEGLGLGAEHEHLHHDVLSVQAGVLEGLQHEDLARGEIAVVHTPGGVEQAWNEVQTHGDVHRADVDLAAFVTYKIES